MINNNVRDIDKKSDLIDLVKKFLTQIEDKEKKSNNHFNKKTLNLNKR